MFLGDSGLLRLFLSVHNRYFFTKRAQLPPGRQRLIKYVNDEIIYKILPYCARDKTKLRKDRMRIPITHYGLPQVVILPVIVLLLGLLGFVLCPAAAPWVGIASVVIACGMLAFFRDPHRRIPTEQGVLLAPADGKVTDISQVQESEFIEGPAIRIGIFLSVLDVHINRSPCAGKVRYLKEHPGKCINALRWRAASEKNQANSVGLETGQHPAGRIMVKQITGAIARRIVCACHVGDELTAGQRFGMIKFGSRTELFLPTDRHVEVIVQLGQAVRAGTTIMVRYHAVETDNQKT